MIFKVLLLFGAEAAVTHVNGDLCTAGRSNSDPPLRMTPRVVVTTERMQQIRQHSSPCVMGMFQMSQNEHARIGSAEWKLILCSRAEDASDEGHKS